MCILSPSPVVRPRDCRRLWYVRGLGAGDTELGRVKKFVGLMWQVSGFDCGNNGTSRRLPASYWMASDPLSRPAGSQHRSGRTPRTATTTSTATATLATIASAGCTIPQHPISPACPLPALVLPLLPPPLLLLLLPLLPSPFLPSPPPPPSPNADRLSAMMIVRDLLFPFRDQIYIYLFVFCFSPHHDTICSPLLRSATAPPLVHPLALR